MKNMVLVSDLIVFFLLILQFLFGRRIIIAPATWHNKILPAIIAIIVILHIIVGIAYLFGI